MQNNTFSGDSPRQTIIVLEEIGSTNDYLKSQLSNFKPLTEWTAIMAKHQSHGRGERDNTWHVLPNQNITFSTLVFPTYLQVQEHFSLNMLISLSIIDWLNSQTIQAAIKWPNDIMLNGKKIGGLLIENSISGTSIRQSIIGVGLNVNQSNFPVELAKKASSLFLETGTAFPDLLQTCERLLESIKNRFHTFQIGQVSKADLLKEYNNFLFRRDILARYTSNGITFEAKLQKVDSEGQLYLDKGTEVQVYQFKEVSFELQ